MPEYIQTNRGDIEECEACIALDDICDWHHGYAEGVTALCEHIRKTLDADF